jgi:hypothetical protein
MFQGFGLSLLMARTAIIISESENKSQQKCQKL